MKKLYLFLIFIALASFGFGQTSINNVTFESAGGYTTSVTEFTDGAGDYFIRTDGSDMTGESFTNIQGSYYFAAQDTDGDGNPTNLSLIIDDIDISGYSTLQLKVYLAEDDSGDGNQDWDAATWVHFLTDIDNSGSFSNVLWVEAEGGANTVPKIDTDFDGLGDGTEITSAFVQFTANIVGTGSLIDIKVEFNNLKSGDEDIAIDNIEIVGVVSGGVLNPTSFTTATNSTTQIDLSWALNGNSDNVMVAFNTSSTFGTPIDGNSYSATDAIAGGGTVLYNGSLTSYNHTSLTANTQYYYKAWSVDGTSTYSSGVTDDATTYKDEPTNHVTSFSAALGTPTYSAIDLTWVDAAVGVLPENYLIKGSLVSYEAISNPVDGTAVADGGLILNVTQGTQTATFTGLAASTPYYFKIYPYTNTGTAIDYKTDESIPQYTATTAAAPVQPTAWINEFHYDNIGSDVNEFIEVVIKNAGTYTLSDFAVYLYNGGDKKVYTTTTVNNFTVGATEGSYTIYSFVYPTNGIQNGSPDGLALGYDGTLISGQFLSYEGSFTALDGPAVGQTSSDIGVSESNSTTPVGYSLQLKGGGDVYGLFSWQDPADDTPGALNNKQYLGTYTTWSGTTDNTWATPTNWNNGEPTSSVNVIIPQESTNYPTISGAEECNNIILESNASGNASILGNADLTVSGTATVERYFEAYAGDGDGWHTVSPPVATMTVLGSDFAPGGNDDLYKWDEVNYIWKNYKANAFNFAAGEGYLVAYESTATKDFVGTLNSADITTPSLSKTDGQGDGWHLLGNPYASALKWNDGNWTLTGFGTTAKIYNESAGNYADIVADGIIPSTNGFFVQVSAGTPTLTIPAAARVHDATNNYKATETATEETLKLTVNNDENGFYDVTRVAFNADADNAFDWNFDSHKMFGQSTAPQLWTIIEDEEFSLNTLPYIASDVVLPLNFKAGVNTTYHINAEGLESFFGTSDIYLEDKTTETMINLRDQSMYSFQAQTDDATNRFQLHFYGINSTQEIEDANAPKIYAFNNTVNILFKESSQDIINVNVFNAMGQNVYSTSLLVGENSFKLNEKAGVYIIQVQSTKGVSSQKVMIK